MSAPILDDLTWAGCPWEVDFFEHGPASVLVAYDPPNVRVRVGDRAAGATAARSETVAQLSADGTVRLGAHAAPPALLLSPTGPRLIPSVPGIDEIATMGADDLLVLCSVGVLENLPAGFTCLLHQAIPGRDGDLLAELRCLTDAEAGCAVVVRRRPLDISKEKVK